MVRNRIGQNFYNQSTRILKRFSVESIFLLLIAQVIFAFSATASGTKPSSIPFVGCAIDDDQPPPTGNPVDIDVPKSIAMRLAIYAGGNQVILAPRGWNCSASEGSAQNSLFVYPKIEDKSKNSEIASSVSWSGDSNYGIKMKLSYGGTYFPNLVTHNEIVKFIAQSNINKEVQNFLVARHLQDKTSYVSPVGLEFDSPPLKPSLGSDILGYPSDFETFGMVELSNAPGGGGIAFLAFRLSAQDADLKAYILKFSENCVDSAMFCLKIANYSN